MVHLGDLVELRKLGKRRKKDVAVKLEISDLDWGSPTPSEEDEDYKRIKLSASPSPPPPLMQELQPWVVNPAAGGAPSSDLAITDEPPCPIGLRLRKSPSLLELIQMRLAEETAATSKPRAAGKRDSKHASTSASAATAAAAGDKLKASNFPVHLLRIGNWECVSRYEGDLVAKCYFAKRKLVWEILDGGLKNKIEIQWSDITAFKAAYSENDIATLDIVLARLPLFYRETNPQPRKHTLWQGTSDFTSGQASKHRRHFLQCQGCQLSKHIEKIMLCDPRLNSISKLPEIDLDSSPYFETATCSTSDAKDQIDSHGMDLTRPAGSCPTTTTSSGFNDAATSNSGRLSPESSGVTDHFEFPSMSSGTNRRSNETFNQGVAGGVVLAHSLKGQPSGSTMSVTDLVCYVESNTPDQRSRGDLLYCGNTLSDQGTLEQIKDALLGDSQIQKDPASSDVLLMNRVNSLLNLIEKDAGNSQDQHNFQAVESGYNRRGGHACSTIRRQSLEIHSEDEGEASFPDCRKIETMTREESFVDLLHQLPRIASLPQFLTLSEDTA